MCGSHPFPRRQPRPLRVRRLGVSVLLRLSNDASGAIRLARNLADHAKTVDRSLAAPQGEGLEHSREPEHVVGMEVGHEDLLELEQPDRGPKELALRAFRAVEQELVAAAADE